MARPTSHSTLCVLVTLTIALSAITAMATNLVVCDAGCGIVPAAMFSEQPEDDK